MGLSPAEKQREHRIREKNGISVGRIPHKQAKAFALLRERGFTEEQIADPNEVNKALGRVLDSALDRLLDFSKQKRSSEEDSVNADTLIRRFRDAYDYGSV